jgi:uncharacterized protein YcbX
MTVHASVAELWLFPVKSMSGQRLDTVRIGEHGLDGDRVYAVVDAAGRTVTAADEPRLRQVVAHVHDGIVRIRLPDRADDVAADHAAGALSAWLGRDVQLRRSDGAGFVDVAPVHLVSTRSTVDAAHAEECDACDVAAPRANLVLELGDETSERDWVGRSLHCGEVALHVSRRPHHCLGVYADVRVTGRLAVGDVVSLD